LQSYRTKVNRQSHSPPARVVCAGVAAFELEYDRWVDEQNRHTAELRNALQPQGQASELELRMLVETGLSNYKHLFQIKSAAAQSDAFYVMSGMWKTPVERFFLWIGGFRPSEVLKVPGLSLRHSAASDARYN
jgi:transcription factor TGA